MLPKILLIEDELSLQETLKLNLELEGYDVAAWSSGDGALDQIRSFSPDLVLLDIMLPGMSGTAIYQELQRQGSSIPVMFLTAKNQVKDKIEGLKLGADDYITKPFDLEELLLRINIVLKRNKNGSAAADSFRFGNCEINFATFEVKTISGVRETISKREMALLRLLTEHANQVVSRDEILEKIWSRDENPSSRTIDNFILNFRKWFEKNPREPIHFQSIRGVGYKFIPGA